jgi:hypothetical protein
MVRTPTQTQMLTRFSWDFMLKVGGRVFTCATTPPPPNNFFSIFSQMVKERNAEGGACLVLVLVVQPLLARVLALTLVYLTLGFFYQTSSSSSSTIHCPASNASTRETPWLAHTISHTCHLGRA